jgi:hypothetical protein
MDKTYEVGQTIFVIAKKGVLSVIPAVVCEVVARKTLSGDSTTYQILAETPKGNRVIDLAQLTEETGEICSTVEELQTILTDRVTKLVSTTVEKLKVSVESLKEQAKLPLPEASTLEQPKAKEVKTPEPEVKPEEDNFEYMTLPDGRRARVRIRMP